MMHIKYKLDKSQLHGLGLFAAENIKKGKLVYTASPILDVNITQEQFNSLSENEQSEIKWWGFFDQSSKLWHVDFDVTKFINHSNKGNVTQAKGHTETYLVAARDVKKGEELTQNYLEFESKAELKKREIKI